MATFEVLKTLNPAGDRWSYKGQIIHNAKKISVSGVVPSMKTDAMIKNAIIADIKRQVAEYLKSLEPPVKKILTEDNIFKGQLS